MISIRLVAKSLYWLGIQVARVKTPQRTYRVVSWDPVRTTEAAGRRWLPNRWGIKLIMFSSQLDWDHWDHWTGSHADCGGEKCPECGGIICDEGVITLSDPDEKEEADE